MSRHATLASLAQNSPRPPAKETKRMRKGFLIGGVLAIALGLLWIGQGTGVTPWPSSSFMISQMRWTWYGAALAAIGLILVWQGKR
jgi:hypothetical protein